VTAPRASVELDAAADIGVRNSQPEGIGRVAALGDLVCWNNLGRNVVFADSRLRPRAVFGTTLFPEEDEPSQYDLDVHAVLDVPELGCVVVVNHFGVVRGFRRSDILSHTGVRPVEPAVLWSFVADMERTVVADGRLVGSRPRSEGANGVVVSAPLSTLPGGGAIPAHLGAQHFGEVTALGVIPSAGGALVAVGGSGRVSLAPLVGDHLGRPRWDTEIGFRVATITWDGRALWAAGPDCVGTVDDYDWERLDGGGFAVLDPSDGAALAVGGLPGGVAWGTGGVAVVPLGRLLVAVGRTGCLHTIDAARPGIDRSTAPLASGSLGIAHTAVVGRRVLYGFNRGGYRLHLFGQAGAHPRTA
jgi:hypothetical protein